MNTQEIMSFKSMVGKLSTEELIAKRQELQEEISKMILDSNLIVKTAIIETIVQERIDADKKGK